MKKILSLTLALLLTFSLVACSGGKDTQETGSPTLVATEAPTEESDVPKLAVGETASTDLFDLTIEKVEFTPAVDAGDDTYLMPTEDTSSKFTASEGRVYVAMTYTLTMKGDKESYGFEGLPGYVLYEGEQYPLKCYHVTSPNGFNINMSASAVVDKESGAVVKKNTANSFLMHKDETVTFRTFEIAKFAPAGMGDAFELFISIPDAQGRNMAFAYTVPAK